MLVYKIDRLGDWLLAEPTLARIVAATRARGGTVAVWAAHESEALIAWRHLGFTVETVAFDPRGMGAKLRRAWALVRLLATYRAREFISLRYSPEPIREFVLAHVAADETYALSWRLVPGPPEAVPHEIARHHAILRACGLEPADARELLPKFPGRRDAPSPRVVLSPFSSAPIKDWRDNSWCEIAPALVARGLHIAIWVGPGQKSRAEGLARMLSERVGEGNVSVRSGALCDLAEAVSEAPLVLTVDTFTAHLAAALDVPMVCLIGGGHYGDFGPWQNSPRQRWVTHALPCFGCDWQCSRARVECLEDIEPAAVLSEIEAALKSRPDGDDPPGGGATGPGGRGRAPS
ncbi:MAG TPA: glycosyltransferase family 9 protein [Opitutaceae bacterium]|nr:glycosyltransferase family 9 protein [Opitutaceae bacterium]